LRVEQWWPEPPPELTNLRTNTPAAVEVLDKNCVSTFKTMANLATSMVLSRAWAAAHEPIPIGEMLWHGEGGPVMVAEDALAFAQASLSMPPYHLVSMMVTLSRVADEASKLLNARHSDLASLDLDGVGDVLELLSLDFNIAPSAERWAAQCLVCLHGWESAANPPDSEGEDD